MSETESSESCLRGRNVTLLYGIRLVSLLVAGTGGAISGLGGIMSGLGRITSCLGGIKSGLGGTLGGTFC